jgi:hypothetical protein
MDVKTTRTRFISPFHPFILILVLMEALVISIAHQVRIVMAEIQQPQRFNERVPSKHKNVRGSGIRGERDENVMVGSACLVTTLLSR